MIRRAIAELLASFRRKKSLEEFSEWSNFRFKPTRSNFRECTPPLGLSLFDWVVWQPDSIFQTRCKIESPKSILSLPTKESILKLQQHSDRIDNATVVFAGEDTLLSEVVEWIHPLRTKFRNIFFEAKDIEDDQIRSFPMGFNMFYLLKAGLDNVRAALKFADESYDQKSGVLAAWGAHWPKLDQKLQDRQAAHRFVEKSEIVERKSLSPGEYWLALAKSRFLIAPQGNGVQAPKLGEAWVTKTIPIVTSTPCFEDLREHGLPLVILQNWEEVTASNLEKWTEQFGNVDWNRVREMQTLTYIQELLA